MKLDIYVYGAMREAFKQRNTRFYNLSGRWSDAQLFRLCFPAHVGFMEIKSMLHLN